MYDGNPGEIDFGSSSRKVWVEEGSSYHESTVFVCYGKNKMKWKGLTLTYPSEVEFLFLGIEFWAQN